MLHVSKLTELKNEKLPEYECNDGNIYLPSTSSCAVWVKSEATDSRREVNVDDFETEVRRHSNASTSELFQHVSSFVSR